MHDITYEIGDKYDKKFCRPLFMKFEKVKFVIYDEVLEGEISFVDYSGAFGIDETSYDIAVNDILYKHIPQSDIFI